MKIWYVLAKEDKRYKYNFYPIFDRSHVFKKFKEANQKRIKKQKDFKSKLVILKRTCEVVQLMEE